MILSTLFKLLPVSVLSTGVFAASFDHVEEDGASETLTGPIKELSPSVHWDHDLFNLQHLVPGYDSQMYYADEGKAVPWVPHQFGNIAVNFSVPTVVLEHSGYIGKVSCTPYGMTISITSREAYAIAFGSWSKTGGFALVCHKAQCGQDKDGHRVYWKASQAVFNNRTRTIAVQATEVDLSEVLTHVNLTYGVWQPHYVPLATRTHKRSGSKVVKRAVRADPPTKTCGDLPNPTISNFPAASCGPNFDSDIDAALGYLDFSPAGFSESLESLAPGLRDYAMSSYNQPTPAEVQARSFFDDAGQFFVAIGQKIADVVITAYHTVAGSLSNVSSAIADAINKAIEDVNNFVVDLALTEYKPAVYINLPIDVSVKPYKEKNPFKSKVAYLIFNTTSKSGDVTGDLSLYCLGCGVKGALHMYGSISFILATKSITSGQVGLSGEITATASLGLSASVEYKHKYQKKVFSQGLPGFSIFKIITIGPVIQLKTVFEIDIKAEVQVIAGVEIAFRGYSATLDLLDKSKSTSTPFETKFTPQFSVTGKVSASAELSVPVSLGVGLVIELIDLDKTISLIETPSLKATVSYTTPKTCVDYDLTFINSIDVDFFGASKTNINTVKKPIIDGCLEIGKVIGARSIETIGDDFETWELPFGAHESNYDITERFVPSPRLKRSLFSLDAPATASMTGATKRADTPPDGVQNVDDSANGPDYKDINDMATKEAEADSKQGALGDQDFDFNSTLIFDSTGTYLLAYNDTGNINLQPSSSTDAGVAWQTNKDIVVSDIGNRVFHYHDNEMNAFGVSRLRLANTSMIPKDAKFITLAAFDISKLSSEPVDKGLNGDTYIGVDSAKSPNHFFPITCTYDDGQPSKVFLSKDLVKGPKQLADEALRFIITGGVVKECLFMPFVANGKPAS